MITVFDMYSKGAKKVSTFDVNSLTKYLFSLTKYLFSLKKAALLADLTKEEYLDYFCYNKVAYTRPNYDAFSNEYFHRIMPYLDEKGSKFWQALYDTKDGFDIRKKGYLFQTDELFATTLKQTLNYLDDKTFDKLKEIAPDLTIDFVNQDIKSLCLEETYDFMYFSNIIQYAQNIFPQESTYYVKIKEDSLKSLKAYKDLIMSFKNNLSYDGKIIVGYIYSIFDEYYGNPIFTSEIREQVFPKDEFSYYYFNSITALNDLDFNSRKYIPKKHSKDACIVYTKK